MNQSHAVYMARALELARQGLYSTSPNPRVGCVIVNDGRIIGEGWHVRAGEGHAEVNALAAAEKQVVGAIVYVTLEPCSHHGKTPPCADALIASGVGTVVYGMQDPNPQVAGAGLEKLRAAGIEVIGPVLEQDCRSLNPGFIQRMQTGKPRVFAKLASSLDGRTAMSSGESQWITGPAARTDVQKLRAGSCAIVTGVGTVMQDNPALTVRDEKLAVGGVLRQPLRVVVDSLLQLEPDSKVLEGPGKCLVVHANGSAENIAALEARGVEVIRLSNDEGKVDLAALVGELGHRHCNDVMVEAGAKLAGAFLQQRLLDELYVYMAPTLLGCEARPLVALPLETMQEQLRCHVKDMRMIGDDVRWHLLPQYPIDNEKQVK